MPTGPNLLVKFPPPPLFLLAFLASSTRNKFILLIYTRHGTNQPIFSQDRQSLTKNKTPPLIQLYNFIRNVYDWNLLIEEVVLISPDPFIQPRSEQKGPIRIIINAKKTTRI